MSLADDFRDFARTERLEEDFPDDVVAETRRFLADPGIDDPALADFSDHPFVTVDGPGTNDLDQAVCVSRTGDGFHLLYAIADASYYAAPGTALLDEALARGASYYFPGFSIPMLPRALSESLVSLVAGAARRALVFDVALDPAGGVRRCALVRGRIRSRKKLAFGDVEAMLADPAGSPLGGEPFADSLRLLTELGDKRRVHEDRKGMVRFRRVEPEVSLLPDGTLSVSAGERGQVELANEQVSILCNALGARILITSDPRAVQPIYRVHAPPAPERVAAFERLVARVARDRGLPDDPWLYRRAARDGLRGDTPHPGLPGDTPHPGLAGYLDALPASGPRARLARALHRQAMLLNGRSLFQAEPDQHYGVGEAVYSRFTAPMREVVGVFCHKEALERSSGCRASPPAEDERLRAAVIAAANRAKDVQRRIDREVRNRVVHALLAPDLARPFDERPRRSGTVMGFAPSGIHVLCDDPPIDVRAPLRDQGEQLGGAWLDIADDGAKLVVRDRRATVCRLGDEVSVRAIGPQAVVISART